MACDRKTQLLISCYADGEATPAESARAAEHLETCAECRKLVEEWQGQRQLLEWACTFELPEEIKLEGRQVEAAQRVVHRSVWPRLRWNWGLASGLAALVVIGFVGYWFATLPPILPVGGKVSPSSIEQAVRVRSGVRLNVGPNSKIVRVDERTIRLDQGWVAANVRHGTGLRVLTKRLEVRDQGTRFWVGTTAGLDSVVVEEGYVDVETGGTRYEVQAGDVLVSQGQGEAHLARLPAAKPDETESDEPKLYTKSEFTPAGGDEMDMDEGMLELAKQFSAVGPTGGSVGGYDCDGVARYRFKMSVLPGLRRGLRLHFQEIAQSIAGGSVDGEWEIPVACVLVDGIEASRPLPAGVYYVRLVASQGMVAWWVSDSAGHQADFPVFYDKQTSGSGGSWHSSGGSVEFTERHPRQVTLHLADWPGELKPSLHLKLNGTPLSELSHGDQPLLGQVQGLVSGVSGFDDRSPDATYLDPQRRHRLIVKWNDDAGKELCRLCELVKGGQGGSAILAAVATDSSFEEPKLPAGAYLLRLTLAGPDRLPRLELGTADSPAASRYVLERGTVENLSAGSSWEPQMPRGCSAVDLHYGLVGTESDAFVYRFWIVGRPDKREPDATSAIWAQGIVRVKKP